MGVPELVSEELDSEEFDKSLEESLCPYEKYKGKRGIINWIKYWYWRIRSFPL